MSCERIIGMAVVVLLLGLATAYVVSDGQGEPSSNGEGRRKSFGLQLASDVSVRKHGYYGIDFIRCESCRLEKRKLGGLTIGAFNVLVLKNLQVVIPPTVGTDGEVEPFSEPTRGSAEEIAGRLGVTPDFLRLNGTGAGLLFSGMKIDGLEVSSLDAATNVVPRFSARSAVAKRDGLHLSDCVVADRLAPNAVGRAILQVKPSVRLVWSGGEMTF